MFLSRLAKGCASAQMSHVQLRNISQVQAVEMETLAVVFKFSFSLISPHFPRRTTITHTVMVPWVHKPACCSSSLYIVFFLSAAPKQPVSQLCSLGRHSEIWVFPLGLPNDNHILLVSAVGIQYKSAAGSIRPTRQGGSVCLSVCLASPCAPVHTCHLLPLPFLQERSSLY